MRTASATSATEKNISLWGFSWKSIRGRRKKQKGEEEKELHTQKSAGSLRRKRNSNPDEKKKAEPNTPIALDATTIAAVRPSKLFDLVQAPRTVGIIYRTEKLVGRLHIVHSPLLGSVIPFSPNLRGARIKSR